MSFLVIHTPRYNPQTVGLGRILTALGIPEDADPTAVWLWYVARRANQPSPDVTIPAGDSMAWHLTLDVTAGSPHWQRAIGKFVRLRLDAEMPARLASKRFRVMSDIEHARREGCLTFVGCTLVDQVST